MADRTVQVDLLNVQRVKEMLANADEEIARLLAERDAVRAVVAEEIATRLDRCEWGWSGRKWQRWAASIAREHAAPRDAS